MIPLRWLLDGSALILGTSLYDPATRALTPLPVTEATSIVPATAGRVVLLDLVEGQPAKVRVVRAGSDAPAVALPDDAPRVGVWSVGWIDGRVLVQVASNETGELRCYAVTEVATALPTCVEGGFVVTLALTAAGPGRVVIDSYGEGHPGVDLVAWTGGESTPIALPWTDLYPFGPLSLLPRTDGSFDVLTRCPLGPERPCDVEDAFALPARWYRWTPGSAPVLRAQGAAADIAPDPASDRVARIRGRRVCVDDVCAPLSRTRR